MQRNSQEVLSNPLGRTDLFAYPYEYVLAGASGVERVRRTGGTRGGAASSAPGRSPRRRAAALQQTDRLVESNNSRHETMAAVDLAAGIGALDASAADRIQHLGLRFKRMLWKLRAG